MGIPVEKDPKKVYDNPLGTDGIPFIEFSAVDIKPIATLLEKCGFEHIANHRRHSVQLWRQGEMDVLLNDDAETYGVNFAKLHGPCISAISFRIADEKVSCAAAADNGIVYYDGDRGVLTIGAPAMDGIGHSLLYLMTRDTEERIKAEEFVPLSGDNLKQVEGAGFKLIDHLTHNVMAGNMERWAAFYRNAFNFREVFYLDTKGQSTGLRTRAMKSPCNRICIPVNEPTDEKSQIQEYIDAYKGEGVQHLAFLSNNLNESIEQISDNGIPLMEIPDTYYGDIEGRMPGHGQDVARLKSNGILIDGDRDESGEWTILLQLFSKNLIGPIFFEFIERRGNEGFGNNNAKALFEAIERDQIKRGVVQAS
ncbi:4-hydroxyphenylpyruvate dioxygenase [Martelella soudanensis]|uniref:4-hydroxyphenylpyruvate dioxygenase n=1 Tax=unclassified Martelella TaxID=2629616 RepID=UPI0015DF2A7D|nr:MULTISPECIES: 4-hydroxyphenylpyruvate dioxygenase [unclassified Martelella]